MSGLFGGQTITNREERIAGVRVQSSTYGVAIPLYYGPNRASPNLLWMGDFNAIEHKSSQSQGGKGGGMETVSITYTYTTALMLGLGEGTVSVDSVMPNKDGFQALSALGLELIAGTVGQATWGHLTANHPTEALGYSGTAYLAASAYALGNSDSIPNFSIQLTGQPSLTLMSEYVDDFLTNSRYGAGFPSWRLSGLTSVDAYLAAEGVTFSPLAVEQRAAADYLREWCDMANTAMVWSDGLLKFIPRPTTVTLVADLGPDDFMPGAAGDLPVKVTRSNPQDAYNQVQAEYLDAAHDYNVAVAEAKDLASIDQLGLRPASPERYHAAKSAEVATWIAQHRLQRKLYVRNTYRFRLGWRHARLEPMDAVTLTEPLLGLDHEPVLITEIGEDDDGMLSVVAEEWNGLTGTVSASVPPAPAGPGVDHGIAPGNAQAPVIFEPPPALSGGIPQLWLATGGGADWGGCEVWASLDDASYQRVGILTSKARHGTLRATLPSGAALDTTNLCKPHLLQGELLDGTTQDATDLLTLCWVAGECLAYRDSTLVAAGDYDLGYLVRGAYGTVIASHASGSKFVRLDDALFKLNLSDLWVGRTLYVKLTSFNIYGAALQSLADVSPTTYTVSGTAGPALSGFSATVFQTSISLAWAPPVEPGNYARVDVLRNTSNNSATATVIASLQPGQATYTDTLGVSGATRYYWVRLVGLNGELGTLSAVASATTGTVGGIYATSTMPGSTYLGQDVVYYTIGEDLWEWSGTAYVRAAPVVNASQINAASLSAISANLGSVTAGAMNIAGKFVVLADGTYQLSGTTGSYVAGGQTDYNTGVGYFLGYSGGAHKLSVGDPAGSYMGWDGEMLKVNIEDTYSAGYAPLPNCSHLYGSNYSNPSTAWVTIAQTQINNGAGVVKAVSFCNSLISGGQIRWLKNDVQVGSVQTPTSTEVPALYEQDITVAKGDIIKFQIKSSSSNMYIGWMHICSQIDNGMLVYPGV